MHVTKPSAVLKQNQTQSYGRQTKEKKTDKIKCHSDYVVGRIPKMFFVTVIQPNIKMRGLKPDIGWNGNKNLIYLIQPD